MPWLDGFAPTSPPSTFRKLIADACMHEKDMCQFDVPGAYLKGKLQPGDPHIFVRPPKHLRTSVDGVPVVWKVCTSWYGEVCAGAIWHRTFIDEGKSRGYRQSEYDPCHMYKVYPDGSRCDICLYVDDGFVTMSRNSEQAKADFNALMIQWCPRWWPSCRRPRTTSR